MEDNENENQTEEFSLFELPNMDLDLDF